ncbi:hypothetical protein BESB_055370 [Besnoitia besnoiti]|uniref:Coiled-coil domain-containing protein 86 n=1 Tax=Besnoitia besnoiti TaxID=94643 RepID=A0A2A9MIU6_BESBE|nr:hypothetical protein BESB_055370 [Besnoitia besnoiti]PFH35886.1 hypothetical protein BESB_055370 [Besnoitia besnoiti]
MEATTELQGAAPRRSAPRKAADSSASPQKEVEASASPASPTPASRRSADAPASGAGDAERPTSPGASRQQKGGASPCRGAECAAAQTAADTPDLCADEAGSRKRRSSAGDAASEKKMKSAVADGAGAREDAQRDTAEEASQADEEGSSSTAEGSLQPGTMAAHIPRVRGKQAWKAKGSVRSFGRFCKEAANRAKGTWETQKRARDEERAMRQAEREMREQRAAVLRRRREKTEEKRRRKEENEMKSTQVQVIKNTTKLRKWGKKARRDLVKMSPEMIQKLYNVRF